MAAPTRPKPAPGPRSRPSVTATTLLPVDESAPTGSPTLTGSEAASRTAASNRARHAAPSTGLALRESKQVVATAGSAIVAAAKVGRIFGRGYLRVAKQLPGARVVEREAVRLGHALSDLRKLLDMPTAVFGVAGNDDEQRVMLLVQNSERDGQPLRTAMSELLDRSADANRDASREYLYGTIVSQLVPDEARILAALASGGPYAAVDLVARQGPRGTSTTVLANASTVGSAARAGLPDNTPTYLTRLHGFGLVEFGAADATLNTQYDVLAIDPVVVAARSSAEAAKQGAVRLRRKTVSLSPLGRDFWAASVPTR